MKKRITLRCTVNMTTEEVEALLPGGYTLATPATYGNGFAVVKVKKAEAKDETKADEAEPSE